MGSKTRLETGDCADEVTLSRAKSRASGRNWSTGTKASTHVDRSRASNTDLQEQLKASRRELAEAREHLAEALEQQTATSEVLQVLSSFPGDLEPVFQSCWRTRHASATPSSGICISARETHFASLRCTARHPYAGRSQTQSACSTAPGLGPWSCCHHETAGSHRRHQDDAVLHRAGSIFDSWRRPRPVIGH